MALPTELVDSLNQTYFLHLLVNDRDRVVPPGKSVLSMLMHSNFRLPQSQPDGHSDLVERVKEVAHKVFWREATEVLSSPMPFVQLPRLKGLYLDLHEALEPLFPPDHHILTTLAAPPPPTSSPLLSTANLLKEILIALRERSAPIRDEQIDALSSTISFPPMVVQHSTLENSLPKSSELQVSPLAQFVIDNIRAVLSLVGDMKSDLNNCVLGSMTEEQLLDVLSTEVKSRERGFVLDLWGGKEELRDLWLSWTRESSQQDKVSEFADYRWSDRLFKALESDKPVFCVAPKDMSTMQNGTTQPMLPPQLFFVIPALVYLQNYIQAIIIAAALQILARPPYSTIKPFTVPSSASASSDGDLRHDFVQHIWALLEAEIDADSIGNPSFDGRPTTTSNNIPETKLINLADEVVHERRKLGSGSLNPDEETRLRDAVNRTLRTSDPVFLVLRKRLFGALEGKLLDNIRKVQQNAGQFKKLAIPERMETGRRPPRESQKVVGIGATQGSSSSNSELKALLGGREGADMDGRFEVPGFEHAVLRNAVTVAYEKLVRCVLWTASVWGNDLKNGV